MISKQEWERVRFSCIRSTWFGPIFFATNNAIFSESPHSLAIAFGITSAALCIGHEIQDHFPKVQLWHLGSARKQILKDFETKQA